MPPAGLRIDSLAATNFMATIAAKTRAGVPTAALLRRVATHSSQLSLRCRTLATGAAALPPLVSPPSSSTVAYIRCAQCQKPLAEPRVCGNCMGVAYCSEACQRAHAHVAHNSEECDNFKRYMSRDVRVSLPQPEPAWLRTAMDHRGDESYSDVLEKMGVHGESAFRLLSGDQGAPSPHRHLIEPIEGGRHVAAGSAPATSWAKYYEARDLVPDTPVAVLLSFPLTLYHIITLHQQQPPAAAADAADASPPTPIRVHYLGPEKEAFLLPLFRELSALLPAAHLEVAMIGPVAFDLPNKPLVVDGSDGGRLTVSIHRGAYHTLAREGDLPFGGKADVVVALNAGLAALGYGWAPTLDILAKRKTPFYVTDYSEYSIDKAVGFAEARGLHLTSPVSLNPFRAPLRQPLVAGGSVGFPWLSNGFVAGFNTNGGV